MVYAYDQWAQMPVKDLYDTQMMLASVNAAKDMYEKAAKQIDDFREKYGDLMFSNGAYQDWYNNEFNVGDKLNEIYSRGGDPLRNQADKAELLQWINSRNYAGLQSRRAWDENMKNYKKSIMNNPDAYDPDFESWRIHGDISNWGDRPFNETSIVPYENLYDMTNPTLKNIEPHLLKKEDAMYYMGEDYNPYYDYTGITEDDAREALNNYMPGLRNSTTYKYQQYLAEQDLNRLGYENPTQEEINNRLVENAISANTALFNKPTGKLNAEGEYYWENKLDQQKTARDIYKTKELRKNTPGYDANGNAIPGYSKSKGGGPNDSIVSIFDEALTTGQGEYVTSEDPRYQWIRPVGKNTHVEKNGDRYDYFVPAADTKNIYLYSDQSMFTYDKEHNTSQDFQADVWFKPVGRLYPKYQYEYNQDGKLVLIPHFFINGTVRINGEDSDQKLANGNLKMYEMEVTEQMYSYGKKQAGHYDHE